MSHLKLCLLGSPQIGRNGAPCELRARKALALLAYLAVTDQPQTRAHLATLFWPKQRESRALAYLRHTLWTLRKALGDNLLEATPEQVGIGPQVDVWLDTRASQSRIAGDARDEPALWFDQSNLTDLVLHDALQSLILARVARLHAPLRQVAQSAAVIGRTFGVALLAELDDVIGESEVSLSAGWNF